MSQTPAIPDYSNVNFAQDTRTERLSLLWKFTAVAAFLVFWAMLVSGTITKYFALDWLIALLVICAGCGLAGFTLARKHYEYAVWSFTGGIIVALVILLNGPPSDLRHIIPFTFAPLIIMLGLLLPPRAMLPLLLIAVAVTVGVPAIHDGEIALNTFQLAALILTGLGALVAMQITGELYGIAEWALESYHREHERKLELHESQNQLTRALTRAQVLAESLEQANEDLEVARAAAEEAKNFRGQFLANMSHELRTPLNAVIGFSETMLKFPEMYDGVPLPAEYERDLQQIYTSGAQLLHVINDILDLSRVDAGKLDVQYGRVDLDPIFKATQTTAVGLIGDKPIKLVRSLPAELPTVWADANRVRQIMLNLYSNAVKFTDEGSITLGLQVVDNHVEISVTDTGCGVEPDEIELIFEEFRQGRAGRRKQNTGSGLGLSISRHLVRLMGGRIWAESEVGVGSKFTFTLPLADSADDTLARRSASQPALQEAS